MRFRTAIILSISLALAAALLATATVVSLVLDRAAHRELGRDLSRGRTVVEDLLRYRMSLHRAESRVLADEPRLKAVVATDDVTRATVVGVIGDLRRALRCDLLLLTDRGGRLIADATHPDEKGDVIIDNPTIATTLETGEAEGVFIDGAQVFQVHGRRLSYGAMTVGAVVVGYRIDDALADTVARQLDADVVVTLGDQIIAGSQFLTQKALDRRAVATSVTRLAAKQPHKDVAEVALGGTHYMMTAAPLPAYSGSEALRYAIFRSLDAALAPARGLLRILYGITIAALVLGLATAVWLSRRLSRPVDALVTFTQRIAGGNLEPVRVSGMLEVQALGTAMNQMVAELATSRAEIAEKTRLAKELEIAQRIQTSILPRDPQIPGLTVEAQMLPASEVGGDYYDLLPFPDGCYLAIGDVAGHGLPAGMVMFMVQSMFAALVRSRPDAAPQELVVLLNQFLHENVRNRLRSDEHVTFMAARYTSDGRFVFAGAHETILVLRQATGRCEQIETLGTWLGVIEDISHATSDATLRLAPGDVVVLYSDGVTEAMNDQNEQFGLERLRSALEACAGRSVRETHAHIMSAVRDFSRIAQDDITLLVLRHEGNHAIGTGT